MLYSEAIGRAAKIVGERQSTHGDISSTLDRTREMFYLTTGINLTGREIALVNLCQKLARMHESPAEMENYLDGVNYMLFALMETVDDATLKAKNTPEAQRAPLPPLKPLNLSERAVEKALVASDAGA
jgi:hypothetical protein